MVCYWQWVKGHYSHNKPINFLPKSIESSLCDYSDAYYILGNITVKRRNAANTADIALDAIAQAAFKNCKLFEKCSKEIDGTLVDKAYLLILQCLCTIWLNTVTIILLLQQVYEASKETT